MSSVQYPIVEIVFDAPIENNPEGEKMANVRTTAVGYLVGKSPYQVIIAPTVITVPETPNVPPIYIDNKLVGINNIISMITLVKPH